MKTLTEAIFESKSPWSNPYQGDDRKVLFVCSAGILRSATAARIYAKKHNTRCAGSHNYALIPVTSDLLLWANEVVFVNPENFEITNKHFKLDEFPCQVMVLEIPDQYEHMHPKLIEAFKEQYEDFTN